MLVVLGLSHHSSPVSVRERFAFAEARLPGALACACMSVTAGVQIIRAHDVAETVQAIRMTEAILANQRP